MGSGVARSEMWHERRPLMNEMKGFLTSDDPRVDTCEQAMTGVNQNFNRIGTRPFFFGPEKFPVSFF